MRFALQYGGVDGGAVAAAEQKAEIRVFPVKVADELREDILHRDGRRRERYLAGGLLLQLAGELGAALENGVRMVVYAPPLLGERDAPLAGADEQRHADVLFERENVAAHGGLREIERLRRGGEAAALDHGAEGLELFEIQCLHGALLIKARAGTHPRSREAPVRFQCARVPPEARPTRCRSRR